MMLDRPPAAVAQLIGEGRLVHGIREDVSLVVRRPRLRHLKFVEQIDDHHSTARGLRGDPVPPRIRKADATKRNAHRSAVAHAVGECGEIEVVEEMYAHAHEQALVYRHRPAVRVGRQGVRHPVGSEHSGIHIAQPGDALGVEPGQTGRIGVPPAHGGPAGVTSGRDQQDVPRLGTHRLAGAGVVQFLWPNHIPGLQPVDASKSGHVKEDSPADDPVGGVGNRIVSGAEAGHVRCGKAVVHQPVHKYVAQGVDMGHRHAVERDTDEIRRPL